MAQALGQLLRAIGIEHVVETVALWSNDLRTGVCTTTPTGAVFFGLEVGDAVAGLPLRRYTAALHPDDRARVCRAIARTHRGGGRYEETYRVARPEGGYRWILAHGQVVMGASGTPARSTGLMIDVGAATGNGHLGPVYSDLDAIADLILCARKIATKTQDKTLISFCNGTLEHIAVTGVA